MEKYKIKTNQTSLKIFKVNSSLKIKVKMIRKIFNFKKI